MVKKSKKILEARTKIDRDKVYGILEAVELVKSIAYAKFDETLEIAIRLNIKKNHSVRDTLVFPNQFKDAKKILVFAQGDKVQEAKDAGATYIGASDLVDKIKGGWLDFDVCVATPDMMRDVGKLGPILGRRGLMPNPKTRTVTNDLKGAIGELQKGRVEYRADKGGVIHMAVAKLSLDASKIVANITLLIDELTRKRPADVKGDFLLSLFISSTMGPSVRISSELDGVA